jgi:hypothetical protein
LTKILELCCVLDGEEEGGATLEDFSDLQELGVVEVLGDDRQLFFMPGFPRICKYCI